MGPDCGTAIIGGVPLGFANALRRGSIGLVAASGFAAASLLTAVIALVPMPGVLTVMRARPVLAAVPGGR